MSAEVQGLVRGKVELECFMCMGEFDCGDYAPVVMCANQHSCCAPCWQELLRNEGGKQLNCPHCSQPLNRKNTNKNRYLITIFELIQAYNKYVAELQNELETLRKQQQHNPRASLLNKNPKMVNSFILFSENTDKLAR